MGPGTSKNQLRLGPPKQIFQKLLDRRFPGKFSYADAILAGGLVEGPELSRCYGRAARLLHHRRYQQRISAGRRCGGHDVGGWLFSAEASTPMPSIADYALESAQAHNALLQVPE